ncbi:MAG: SpoIIE family protein phosphatase [Clostridia bacterium]|nr:SpoIIE family protein phosphatase [Clostridia bacterium]
MQGNVKERGEEVRNEAVRDDSGGIWRGRLRRIFGELVWVGGGWLFGGAEMLFGTHPLGIALLCASGRHTLAILIGLIASSLASRLEPVVYISTYVAAALVRIVSGMIFESAETRDDLSERLIRKMQEAEEISDGKKSSRKRRSSKARKEEEIRRSPFGEALHGIFSESVCLRMATAAVCSFIVAFWRIVSGGFQYYDWFAAIFVVLVAPVAVLVYSVSLGDSASHALLHNVSRAAILFSLIWSAGNVTAFGIPLAVVLSLFFTLMLTEREGGVAGSVTAILCGLAYAPLYAPGYLLASLLFTISKGVRRQGSAVLLAVAAQLSWAVYVGGASVLTAYLPAALIGGVATTIALRFREESEENQSAKEETVHCHVEGSRRRDANDHLRGISDAFSSLSEIFYNLSDRFRRPGTLDLRRICDISFDAFCTDCPNKTVCWGLEYSNTLETVSHLTSALHTKGKVTREQIPSALSHRCESVDEILERINRECAKLTGDLLRNNRTEIFAMDYEAAAKIINDALEDEDGEYRFDGEEEQKIAEYLKDAGVRAQGVTVYGNRRRRILVRGVDVEHATVTVETLRSDLAEMCGLELSRPIFEVEGNLSTMSLQAKKKIRVTGAQNNVAADGGISGDTVNLFSNKKDYFYALISDGMGAGKEAALTSSICSVFLEKMLRAGNRASTSLRMLNNMIRSRGADSTRECSSTVDLLELDLITADASFMKSGAAPSFVVRGRVVHRLQAGTAPIGIISALDVQSDPFPLKAGDTVVMVSDGILQNDEDAQWLTSYLTGIGGLSPEEIVYHICVHACEKENHDDCSAIALRIEAAE